MTKELLAERILILDGGLGTMIQGIGLTEDDYRGKRFADYHLPLADHYDLLNITCPDVIYDLLRQYLDAGADIITTNTLNANAVSMEDYGMQSLVREINMEAAQIGRSLADDFMRTHTNRPVFVAGSIGPTNKTASMSPRMNDPAFRAVSYMDLYHSYYEQIDALCDGGVDILLFETTFDTLNVKAGLDAALQMMQVKNREIPIMLSLTLSGKGGRTFSGQTLPALLASIQHIPLISIGLNCSFGASDMKPSLKEIAGIAPYYISVHPNAGLPNQFGQYDETPESMAAQMKEFVDEGLVNIIGGCCGTTPAHIALFSSLVEGAKPHRPCKASDALWLSGLELLEAKAENNFINIGERCNVAGSRKFLRLIKEKKYEEALMIARKQVEDGAQIIDINMDDGLLDAKQEMKTFLNLIASEPDIARVPVMIDSSDRDVIEQGLMCVQGKSIVNSISLKEGEAAFLNFAGRIHRLGAAVIVMAFDEKGQADTYERKIEICARAYRLLTEQVGFKPQDIIFDPNVLAIATGMSEHNFYGIDFIRSVAYIKKHLPGAKVSGGISNLSFSFRGNNYVREAMHAVFLYHAIRAGMDMGIVNPSTTVMYEDIEPLLRTLLEDVILARRPEAADELTDRMENGEWRMENGERGKDNGLGIEGKQVQDSWRKLSVEERLEYALIKGNSEYLGDDLQEAMLHCDRAVQIIDGPLMTGMKRVGELFGEGKVFLPQVVKTARTMKKAVEILQPYLERNKSTSGASKAGKIIIATVKGDVHDIGKNIVSIVLTCNNYEVIDLGVMVPADRIIEAVVREKPDLLCLSGLITPSLEEMIQVVKAMQKANLQIPVMIGGATTSKIHTALKIAPHYDYPVVHVTDASQNPIVASQLLNSSTSAQYIKDLNTEYEQLRVSAHQQQVTIVPLAEARRNKPVIDRISFQPVVPAQQGIHDLLIQPATIIPYINWNYFFKAWGLTKSIKNEKLKIKNVDLASLRNELSPSGGGRGRSQASDWLNQCPEEEQTKATEAMKLYHDACDLLQQLVNDPTCFCHARYGFFEAESEGDDILIGRDRIPTLRQQMYNESNVYHSLADYVMPASDGQTDYLGAFVVTVNGLGEIREIGEAGEIGEVGEIGEAGEIGEIGEAGETGEVGKAEEKDPYRKLLLQSLADRLAEASSEYLHQLVRKDFWGYANDESLAISDLHKGKYQGIRPAVGYPSLPDQGIIFTLDKLLQFDKAGVRLTENGAMMPSASIAGLYFAHPQARYFMIGQISEEQLRDYAARRNEPVEKITSYIKK